MRPKFLTSGASLEIGSTLVVRNFAKFLLVLVFVVAAFFAGTVLAQGGAPNPTAKEQTAAQSSPGASAKIQGEVAGCFDYYHFGSVRADIAPERTSYAAGEPVRFRGRIVNANDYPVVHGELYAQILRDNTEDDINNGGHLVDSFLAADNIVLKAGEEKDIGFERLLPAQAIGGKYIVAFFFVVDKKYNLAGLTFLNDLYAGFTPFEIRGATGGVYLDRNNVKINGAEHHLRSIIQPAAAGKPLVISMPLKNTGPAAAETMVKYSLYYWDALQKENLIDTNSESISLAPNAEKPLTYTIQDPRASVYLLEITALSGGARSMIDVRPTFAGAEQRGRVNYAAITKFPVQKGDQFTSFVCYHSTSGDGIFDGKVESILKDKQGNVIDTLSYEGGMGGEIAALKSALTASRNYDYLTLATIVYDKGGKKIEESALIYDCKDFGEGACAKYSPYFWPTVAGIAIFVLIAAAIYFRSGKKDQAVILAAIGILIVVSGLLYQGREVASYNAVQTALPKIGGLGGANYSITNTYSLNLSQGAANLVDGQTLTDTAAPIDFTFSKKGEWIYTGGWSDSPAVLWDQVLSGAVAHCTNDNYTNIHQVTGCTSYYYTDFACATPNNYVRAVSGPVTCSGARCTITGAGAIKVKTGVDQTSCQGMVYAKDYGGCTWRPGTCYASEPWSGVTTPAESRIWTFTVPGSALPPSIGGGGAGGGGGTGIGGTGTGGGMGAGGSGAVGTACGNGTCETASGETCSSCAQDCGDCPIAPTYSLTSTNNLSITQIDSGVACSNKTTLKVIPYGGYSGDVTLSVGSWGGFAWQSKIFNPDTLTFSQYDSGAQFSVCAKAGASPGNYILRIDGTDGKSVNVRVNVSAKSPGWQEI